MNKRTTAQALAMFLFTAASARLALGCSGPSRAESSPPSPAVDAGVPTSDASLPVDAAGIGTPLDAAPDVVLTPVSTVFTIDAPNVVRRSNLVLSHPNTAPTDAMALGNGTLGMAVWGASGLTAQINRSDTFPDRKAVAQLTVPGLAPLLGAADFAGKVDLYDATLEESGGGMTASVFVRADAQEIVIDVTGADPSSSQTARLQLWSGRSPATNASGGIATLSETWGDDGGLGASGAAFGVLSAVTAAGQNVTASVVDPLTVEIAFQPNPDGTFRVVVAAPTWAGGDAAGTAKMLLGADATAPLATLTGGHLAFWHDYWSRVGLLELHSSDGSAEYVEALRTLYLFYAAAERGDAFPGSQAGLAGLFAYLQDAQPWLPAAYWVWNLRMQVFANMGSGAFDLNTPVFDLYDSNVAAMEVWTQSKMGKDAGICLPETMRFNGNGYWYGGENNASCDQAASPSYNALTLTSGAEVSLWAWRQYQMTGDTTLLRASYPLMRDAAQFLLASTTTGSDGLLHTNANAHETQWAVNDPITDLVAMRALFPAVAAAAELLGKDASLVTAMNAALAKLPPLPRTDAATHKTLLGEADDDAGTDVLALSYEPSATQHNGENLDLEAAWPYGVIGDDSALTPLARRTYQSRMFVNGADWSFDAVQAARLGLGDQVGPALTQSIQKYQSFANGLALLGGGTNDGTSEPYVEQLGIVTLAVNEATAQDYDGLLRIAPALPKAWDAEGTLFLSGGSKLDLRVASGEVAVAIVEAGSDATMTVRNPWPGVTVSVVDGATNTVAMPATASSPITFAVQRGHFYEIVPTADGGASASVNVTGTPATAPKTFGPARLGL
ncbi:MAG TPA: hypothetical protein VGI39_05400 [Polyangiaceae bacterium]|jgi:hypothetical protein